MEPHERFKFTDNSYIVESNAWSEKEWRYNFDGGAMGGTYVTNLRTNTSILHNLQHRGLSACLSQLCAGSLPTEEMCCNILEWPIDLNWARIKPKLDSSPLIEGPR